jgi:hypothetical protein
VNIIKTAIFFGAATATIFLGITAKQTAVAGSLYLGWNYAIDPNYDSLGRNEANEIVAGGTIYEIYRMAVKEDVSANTIWVAINANLPLAGNPTGDFVSGYPISNRNIGFGDLFFDFSGLNNFKSASDSNSLFGIRFASNNDSNVASTGLYSGVKAKSVVAQNAGWSNLYNHNNGVLQQVRMNAAMGYLEWKDPYYSPYLAPGSHDKPETLIPNIIESGNKVGDITMVGGAELLAAGFILGDPEYGELGTHTFGFKFDKSLLPVGSYVASLILECNNDAIALEGETQPFEEKVPEPSLIFGTLLGFGAIIAKRKRQQKLGM